MRQPVTSQVYRPQAGCEVCRAAAELVRARDSLVNSGMDMVEDKGRNASHPIITRMKTAVESWEYAKNGRHTGAPHAPEVV